MYMNILFFSLLAHSTLSILIPLSQHDFRCMLIYSMGNDETVKIDINFPYVKGWLEEDHYHISLRNTKTDGFEEEVMMYGLFRREIQVLERTIYQICFELRSQRQIKGEFLVEYNADTHYMINHQKIKIPNNLLKSEQMRKSYQQTAQLAQLTLHSIHQQKGIMKKHEISFEKSKISQNKMIILGILELLFIAGMGIYQLHALKGYIQQNDSII